MARQVFQFLIECCGGKRFVNKARFEEAFSRAFSHLADEQQDVNSTALPKSERSAPIRKRSASQGEHDTWYRQYVAKCKASRLSPNTSDDEKAARDYFKERYNRDRLRDARRRIALAAWKSRSKRRRMPKRNDLHD